MEHTDYTQVGTSGLFTWKVGLGTMQFGWTVDEPGSFEIMDAYAAAGGNFIDTADVYSAWAGNEGGPPNPGGVSEEIIGRWMADRGNRDQMVVATKVRGAMGEGFSQGRTTIHQREGLGRGWIARACEDSLRRLQTDHIDLYQVHWIDPLVPIEETLGALTDLVRQGKVRYLGCSNFSAWRIVQSLWAAERNNLESFVSLQPEYNLLAPTRGDVERELAPVCQTYGIGMVPYSPLAAGMLTGKYQRGQDLPDSVRADGNRAKWISDQNWDAIEALTEVADDHDMPPASAAIQWLRAKPWVASPIIGANRPSQLHDTLAGLDTPLSADAVERLDDVSDFHRPRFVRED